jgi:hypothetical protein
MATDESIAAAEGHRPPRTTTDVWGHVLTLPGLPMRDGAAGGVLAGGCAAALAVPVSPALAALLLGMLGLSLGVYIPANNATTMATIPPSGSAAVGGLVSMARGLGTALGGDGGVAGAARREGTRPGHAHAGRSGAGRGLGRARRTAGEYRDPASADRDWPVTGSIPGRGRLGARRPPERPAGYVLVYYAVREVRGIFFAGG